MKRYICLVLTLLLLLCGCGAETKTDDSQILAQRRDAVEARMRHMMSVLWQTDTDITYSYNVNSMGVDMDKESYLIHLKAGRIYSGMPYTHGSGAAEPFLSYGEPDENGVYQMTGLTSALFSGGGGAKMDNRARLSNDCADAVYWAWSTLGNSFSFTMTQNMTASRGCLPVGNYTTEDNTYSKTREIAKNNGEEVMFQAYACLQKADAVVTYNNAGHAMLVADVHVTGNGDAIDPEESYILVHEQFTKNYSGEVTYVDNKTGEVVYCLGGVDRKYTFAQLFKSGYLPITIKELNDPAPVEDAPVIDSLDAWDYETITAGNLATMAKIASVTVIITDPAGTVLQEATCSSREAEHVMFRMENFTDPMEQDVIRGNLDLQALTPGKYHCKTLCVLGTGETVTVRDFDFEVK